MTCPHEIEHEQSVRNRGSWLLRNEAALKACQSFLTSKFWEAMENEQNSVDLDGFLLEINDHMELLSRVVTDLRLQNFWPAPAGAPAPAEPD